MNPTSYLLVAAGGAIGSMGRAWVGLLAARLFGIGFPWGTMIVNVLGSAVIGVFAATALSPSRTLLSPELRIFLMVGFCGGFTTFSSFSLQTFELLRDGRPGAALANILASVALCIAATAAAYVGTASLVPR
ncbi:MAG TPA: fluoride efflux transporter CrcB [Acidisoma sp.]|uniref:fluoride efflux transporter CrcB n=1 Tax=Acidisoma sp. TaxID=1872115 RepID=UPI002B583C1A|nr:fluoride efflux transporter CrcB [Acidisoma sp.]HTI03097.1 fluoride efflux transporter CrcB [Acidisoma sp.]